MGIGYGVKPVAFSDHLCGYFACSTGNVSTDMIAAYIEGHTDEEDNFKVAEE